MFTYRMAKAAMRFPNNFLLVVAACLCSSSAFVYPATFTVTSNPAVSRDAKLLQLHAETDTTPASVTTSISIVERCYDAWNQRKMNDAVACFADEFSYDDGQYLGSITDKSTLQQLFQRGAKALPPQSVVVVDDIAICPTSGNIGTRWHAEKDDGSAVPLTRGCSFYTVDKESGLIKSGFRASEMIIKPSKQFSNSLVSSTSRLMNVSEQVPFGKSQETKIVPADESSSSKSTSIIESYFQAWNSRDMEAALDCFVDDCIYETEDPVFVDTFKGKQALREHLVKNAKSLPSACNIILDDLAIDSFRGTYGVRWHLEVNGFSIPNLRGCSMYTADEDTGLLKSGFDVTEAPLKLPGLAQDVFTAPFSKLLGWN